MRKAPKDRLRIGNIAFWDYDLFPYLTSGTIDKVDRNDGITDCVHIAEYNSWWRVSSVRFVLPPTAGKDMQTLLILLKDEYGDARRDLEEGFYRHLIRYLRVAGVEIAPVHGRCFGIGSGLIDDEGRILPEPKEKQ